MLLLLLRKGSSAAVLDSDGAGLAIGESTVAESDPSEMLPDGERSSDLVELDDPPNIDRKIPQRFLAVG